MGGHLGDWLACSHILGNDGENHKTDRCSVLPVLKRFRLGVGILSAVVGVGRVDEELKMSGVLPEVQHLCLVFLGCQRWVGLDAARPLWGTQRGIWENLNAWRVRVNTACQFL